MFVFFLILFGQGLKLGPINFIDELGLAVGALNKIKFPKIQIKYNLQFYFGLYFFIINIVGFFFFSEINAIRISLIGLLLCLYSAHKIDFFSKTSILAVWLYPIVIIIICIYEISNGLRSIDRMWHQEWLWSGSAYSSLGILVSCIIAYLYYAKKPLIYISHFIISAIAGIITDSRTTVILLIFLFLIMVSELVVKSFSRIKNIFSMLFVFSILIIIGIYYYDLYKDQITAAVDTLSFVAGNSYRESDQDRFNQLAVMYNYFSETNLFNSLFGYGGESFKTVLVDFLGADASAERVVVRPTGFPAYAVMGGFFFLVFLYSIKLRNVIRNFFTRYFSKTYFFTNLKLSYLHLVIFIFPFITNVLDSVLYFIIIFKADDLQKAVRSLKF